jgi:hypothetical protein
MAPILLFAVLVLPAVAVPASVPRVLVGLSSSTLPVAFPGIPDDVVAQYLYPPESGCSQIPSHIVNVRLASPDLTPSMPLLASVDGLEVTSWRCSTHLTNGEVLCMVTYDIPATGDPHPLVQAMLETYSFPNAVATTHAMRPMTVIGFAADGIRASSQFSMPHPFNYDACNARFARRIYRGER